MPSPITLQGNIVAGTTAIYRGKIVDDQEPAVGFQPTELRVTLTDVRTSTIINSRNNALLTPIATYVDSGGILTFPLLIADNVIVTAGQKSEMHRLHFKWTWSSATKVMVQDIDFEVVVDRPEGPSV